MFCGPRTADIAQTADRLYRAAGLPLELVFITPSRDIVSLSGTADRTSVQVVADEDVPGYQLVSRWLADHAAQFAALGRSSRWYLQQYLKLAYAWSRASPTFIHDGDTIFAPRLLLRLCNSKFVLTTKEDASLYNLGCQRLGIEVATKRSLIANGGLFDGELLRPLGSPEDWFIRSIQETVLHGPGSDFSEYQIVGNLLLAHHPNQLRPMKFFRRFDLLTPSGSGLPSDRRLQQALKRYDAIAFERGHQQSLRHRLAGRLVYWAARSW
jgi:hypothetical protein